MFKNNESHIFINEDKSASESGAVVLFRTQTPDNRAQRFIAASMLVVSLGLISVQANWVYSASAQFSPVTSPVFTPTPTPIPTPTATPSISPMPTPTANPSICPAGKTAVVVNSTIVCVGQTQNQVVNQSTSQTNPIASSSSTVNYTINNPITAPEVSPSPSSAPVTSPEVTPSPSDNPVTAPEVSPSPSSNPGNSGNGNGGNGGNNTSSNNGGSIGAPSCNTEAPKNAPVIISAVSTGKNQITLNWSPAQGNVTEYVVAYGLVKGKPMYGAQFGNVTSTTIKGLAGGITYFFKVRAGNGCMPGAYSEEIAVKVGGKFINAPAQGFKQGVLGTNKSIKPVVTFKSSATPAPIASGFISIKVDQTPNVNPNNGLFGKIFNFFGGFFH